MLDQFGDWLQEWINWLNFEQSNLQEWLLVNLQLVLLPLRVAMMQLICLLMAIAIEGGVLHQRFGISRKGSMQYAVILNLASTVTGWMIFFILQLSLPEVWRLEILQFILFNRFSAAYAGSLNQLVFLIGLGIYFGTFLLEVQVLNLVLLLQGAGSFAAASGDSQQYDRLRRYKASLTDKIRLNALLIANALSFGAILVLLLLVRVLYL